MMGVTTKTEGRRGAMKKDNHYFGWGLTAVCVVCAVMLIYDLVFRDSIVMIYTRKLMEILAPILYGAAIAYLLAPIVNWFERVILPRAGSRTGAKGVRAVSMVLTWVVVFALFYGLLSVLLPELYKSIRQLVGNLTTYYGTIEAWMLRLLENNPDLARRAQELFNQYYQQAFAWLRDNLAPQLQVAVQAVTGGVVGVLVFFKNLFLGIMVSLYLLGSKEHFAAAGCKLCYTFLPEDRAAWFIRGIKATDRIFSGFVRGKLLDSLIIGVLCFIGCSVLKFPYTPLISVFIGVTNVIPFFGPFLGAIPSAFLILLVSPLKALYFLIFVLVLQQLDGNVIGPMILGDKTGLSSLWVIIAILVGGSFFGIPGMFFGVPVCACLYCLFNFLLDVRLRQKNLPTALDAYKGREPDEKGRRPEHPAKAW